MFRHELISDALSAKSLELVCDSCKSAPHVFGLLVEKKKKERRMLSEIHHIKLHVQGPFVMLLCFKHAL